MNIKRPFSLWVPFMVFKLVRFGWKQTRSLLPNKTFPWWIKSLKLFNLSKITINIHGCFIDSFISYKIENKMSRKIRVEAGSPLKFLILFLKMNIFPFETFSFVFRRHTGFRLTPTGSHNVAQGNALGREFPSHRNKFYLRCNLTIAVKNPSALPGVFFAHRVIFARAVCRRRWGRTPGQTGNCSPTSR